METTYRATRVHEGSKAVIVVRRDGEVIDRQGGKIAERATAVIIGGYTGWQFQEDGPGFEIPAEIGVLGYRADFAKAKVEAERLLGATKQRRAAAEAFAIAID
ncbi:MAG: hypothetical protein KGH75_00295 [Rhodospirillales bacterium]|nr:hypothetical protein [Rhodospirillales bacterium]